MKGAVPLAGYDGTQVFGAWTRGAAPNQEGIAVVGKSDRRSLEEAYKDFELAATSNNMRILESKAQVLCHGTQQAWTMTISGRTKGMQRDAIAVGVYVVKNGALYTLLYSAWAGATVDKSVTDFIDSFCAP